jgi:YidC/Oxa1 family membrane protein insertase
MNDQRNIILAVVLTMVILFGYDLYMSQFEQLVPAETSEPGDLVAVGTTAAGNADVNFDDLPAASAGPSQADTGMSLGAQPIQSHDEAIASSPRIPIVSDNISGSLRLTGGRIDDLSLSSYHETLDAQSPGVTLLAPQGTENPYFVDYGWVSTTEARTALPGANTPWTTSDQKLAPGSPVTLTWDNGEGLLFSRVFEIDENYMLSVTQGLTNNSNRSVSVQPYGLIKRTGTPEISGFFILHEGPIGVFEDGLEEISYEDLRDDAEYAFNGTGGWAGITDKYWLTAIIPANEDRVSTDFRHRTRNGVDHYQTSVRGDGGTLAPGQSMSTQTHLFAGAKINSLIDDYAAALDIRLFDRAIDWGVLYYLTKPIFFALKYINDYVGNFGVAILLLTVLIKLLFFQLANKSYVSMSGMRKLQPKMAALREQYADDKPRQQQELMKLYKEEKVNPVSGCLPMLIQIPVFFALYKVLFVSIEMRHAPFFGWVHDLSAPDPLLVTNLFGLIPWDPPSMIAIGVWPLAMGISMFVQQKLNPAPPDPIQAKIFLLMPIMFTFLLAAFPVGLVIYWTWNNLLTIAQQSVIMKRHGAFDQKPA